MLNAIRRSIDDIDKARADQARAAGEGTAGLSAVASGDGGGGSGAVEAATGQSKEATKVLVTTGDFLEALANLTPSVTPEQIAHYTSLHAQFSPDN
jgi:SpoVK/Ycf46/Vps4 family AAA+-type ATPase